MKLCEKLVWIVVATLLCLGYKQQTAHAGVVAKFGDYTFLTPVNHAPEGSSFEYKNTGDISGEIACAYANQIVVRTLKDGMQKSVISLPAQKGGILFDVQLSPNGRYVLFKNGSYGNSYDTFRLFYWDLKTKQVFQGGTKNVIYYRVNWSPSSRYIAYCLGGDVNGDQHAFPNVNTPLRLYTYDTQTHQTHFIAQGQGVIGWVWGNDDTLFYAQKKHDRKWVEGGKNPPYSGSIELYNIYRSLATGGKSSLVLEGAVPLTTASDSAKILVSTYFKPDLPKDKREIYPHEAIRYSHLGLYDTKQKKLTMIEGIGSYFQDVRFISDTQILFSQYYYYHTTGTLTVKSFDLATMKSKTIAHVEEIDSIPSPNRAVFQPQFGYFRLFKTTKNYFFSSSHFGKESGVDSHGAIKIDSIPVHLNTVDLRTGSSSIVCETDWSQNFSWGPIFEGGKE